MLSGMEVVTLLAAVKNGVDIFDKISGQITRVLAARPQVPADGPDRRIVTADDKQITVKLNGKVIQTLTRAQLETELTREQLQHIQTYEASMKKFYARWSQLYPKRESSSDELVNVKLNEQLTEQIRQMSEDLAGIVDFLQNIGVEIDDHYEEVRNLVRKL